VNVLIIYAHHEPTSFTSAMKNAATEVLSAHGHNVVISDLYGQGFNPVAQKWDFITTSGGHFNYMLEQRHAARLDLAFAPDITGEIQKVQTAELILFVAPIWWLSVPAILKGWFDRVLAMGVAWDSGKIYEAGLMKGKQAMFIGPAGGPAEFYKEDGRYKATPEQILQPLHHGTLAACGFNVHEPFIALNMLGQDENGRAKTLTDLQFRVEHMVDSPQWLIYQG
jgi:NAD(P)H dehydrogenase (quinone)